MIRQKPTSGQEQADTFKVEDFGADREALERKARQREIARHLDQWMSSPGLQPPK